MTYKLVNLSCYFRYSHSRPLKGRAVDLMALILVIRVKIGRRDLVFFASYMMELSVT